MAEAATKLPVRTEEKKTDRPTEWRPFESLRREVERLFDDFQVGSWRSPIWSHRIRRRAVQAQRDRMGQGSRGRHRRQEQGVRDHGGAARTGRKQHRRQIRRWYGDHQGRETRRERGERRTIICRSVAMARSSVRLAYRTASTPTRSQRPSRTACSRSPCPRPLRRRKARRKLPSTRLEAGRSFSLNA